MAGIDDNVAIIGDWVPPSPRPRAFFSTMLGDNINSRTIPESPREKRNEGLYLGQPEQMTSENADKRDGAQTSGVQLTELGTFSEQKSNFRGGLVERMAARAGFNAPRLNTESIRPTESSMNPEIRSPYLTIPPGLSPTTLLESPVFLSNLDVLAVMTDSPYTEITDNKSTACDSLEMCFFYHIDDTIKANAKL